MNVLMVIEFWYLLSEIIDNKIVEGHHTGSLLLMSLIASGILTVSCGNTRHNEIQHTIDQRVDSMEQTTENKTLTLIISDYGSYSPTQIIQFTDSTMKHGFATVIFPFDTLTNRDIIWEPDFELDGIKYPIIRRHLNDKEKGIVRYMIEKLENNSYEDQLGWKESYSYILYIDSIKVAYAFEDSLYPHEDLGQLDSLPSEFKQIFQNILSMAAPIYPNWGVDKLY